MPAPPGTSENGTSAHGGDAALLLMCMPARVRSDPQRDMAAIDSRAIAAVLLGLVATW